MGFCNVFCLTQNRSIQKDGSSTEWAAYFPSTAEGQILAMQNNIAIGSCKS